MNAERSNLTCSTCGAALRSVRVGAHSDAEAQCSRCVNIEALMEELIRRQMRQTQWARTAAV